MQFPSRDYKVSIYLVYVVNVGLKIFSVSFITQPIHADSQRPPVT